MSHGDDSGLRLPPRIAPIQVVIVPISIGHWQETILPAAEKAAAGLEQAGVRVFLDKREEYTPGWKFADWEMRGVPLRLEIGPRDVSSGQAVAVRRDRGTKESLSLDNLAESVPGILKSIQENLFNQALEFRRANTRTVRDYEEFKILVETKRGFLLAPWCGERACEEKIKEETMATIRVIPLNEKSEEVACLRCGKKARHQAYFARAY